MPAPVIYVDILLHGTIVEEWSGGEDRREEREKKGEQSEFLGHRFYSFGFLDGLLTGCGVSPIYFSICLLKTKKGRARELTIQSFQCSIFTLYIVFLWNSADGNDDDEGEENLIDSRRRV